jgi:hypothetical protein
VDWLRTSYESEWLLFRGRADRTRGRYVRLPQDAPHYPGLHNLGSRVWTSDERDPQPELGECNDTRHRYYNGAPAGIIPPAGLIGNADCIANGETNPGALFPREFVSGWDTRCYALPAPPIQLPPPFPTSITVLRKSALRWYWRVCIPGSIILVWTP